ncbi:importin subunit beta-3-like [Nicotiana tomentosiformis]|uniref:importin subunit beta-3-like n=1 Tax=Nicotiana tomentosiformis TaxID=4098 RepID=UPI00388CEB40
MASPPNSKIDKPLSVKSDILPKRNDKLRPVMADDDHKPRKKARAPRNFEKDALRMQARDILGSPNHDAIETLIANLASPIETVLSEAENLYYFLRREYPNALSLKISKVLLHSLTRPKIKSECASLLQNLIDSPSHYESVWNFISPMIKTDLKIAFLEILRQENSSRICKPIWKTVSEVFNCIITKEQGEWPGMLSCFYERLRSGPSYVQDFALMFFLKLPMCLRKQLEPYVNNLYLDFLDKLNSFNEMRKRLALAASIHLVGQMSSDYYFLLNGLLMPMIKGVLSFLINDNEEGYAQESLRKLVELAWVEPRFFESHLDEVFDTMVTIAENNRFLEDTRYLAVEMMSAFDDYVIKRVGKKILRRLFFELVEMISRIEDDPMGDVDYVNGLCLGTSQNYLLGVTFMYRISMATGDQIRMPVLLKELPTYMAAAEWQKRYAAVTVIGVIANGCAKAMRDHLSEVMNMVLKSMLDSSPHVRLAAIGTIKAMSLELSPDLLDKHGHRLIASLYLALADDHYPDRQAVAASAMNYLCEGCKSCILEPYLDKIVSKLLALIQSPSPVLKAEALNTLAFVARSSKDIFTKCYDLVITYLKKFLADAMIWPSAASKSLQDNALECIWTVAMAVGEDIFKKDAAEVVVLLLSVRWYLAEDDHRLKVTLLRAWAELLSCFGSGFYPYVKDLMPNLLQSARLGFRDEEIDEIVDWSARERVVLTEKLMACKVLFRLTSKFKEKLFPWIDQVSDILIPLVIFHDGDIRNIAVSAMPKLLLSAKLSVEKKEAIWRLPNCCSSHSQVAAFSLTNSYLNKLVRRVVPSLLEALNKETDSEICANILKSLSKCIKISGPFLSEKKIERIANAIIQVQKATSTKQFSKEENATQLEKEIIKQVVNYFSTLIKIYKKSSWTFVDELLECIKDMLVSSLHQ